MDFIFPFPVVSCHLLCFKTSVRDALHSLDSASGQGVGQHDLLTLFPAPSIYILWSALKVPTVTALQWSGGSNQPQSQLVWLLKDVPSTGKLCS